MTSGRAAPLHAVGPSADVATRARQLAPLAERHRHDPFTEIDWSIPLDDRSLHLPERCLPLHDTAAWEAMAPDERNAYSRHECAAFFSTVIWFENILMALVVRQLHGMAPDDPSHRWLLDEMGDECRHCAMFGEYIRRAGTPAYRPSPRVRLPGALVHRVGDPVAAFIAILAGEELVDATDRAAARAPDIHPVSRRIAQIHVAEEGRHVSYARAFLAESWPTLNRARRLALAAFAPVIAFAMADALVNPAVYRTLGIAGGQWMALTNPRHHERIAHDFARLTAFLTDIDVISPGARPAWRALGLLADE